MALFGFKKEEKKEKVSLRRPEGSESRPKASGDGAKVSHSPKVMGFSVKKPLVTEKALMLEGGRQYVFEVVSGTSKPQVKKDIENLYGVKVESVNIINSKRQTRFIRGKTGFNPGSKKAIIKLQEGYKIEVAPR